MELKRSAIRYSSNELIQINNNRFFEAPKLFKNYKMCFTNAKRNRIDYFSWNPQFFWDLKQREKQTKSNFNSKNWRVKQENQNTVFNQKKQQQQENLKKPKQEKNESNDNLKAKKEEKNESNDNFKAKKQEIFQMAERAAKLSNELFILHKKLNENNKDNSIVNDSINISLVSSGYHSMNSTINESITEIVKDEISVEPLATVTNEPNSLFQINIIEHVRKIYQNALLRSQLNKINKNKV
jgi:hypothetical protein